MSGFRLFAAGCAALIILAGCHTPEPVPDPGPPPPAIGQEYSRAAVFIRALELLRTEYVDTDNATVDKLFVNAMKGMAGELDPYSGYEPPNEYSVNEAKRTGEQTGIGVEVSKPDDSPLVIIDVMPDSPAEKAGLKPGDRLIEIDGKPTRKLHLDEALLLARGPEGSDVMFKVARADRADLFPVTLRRARVVRPSVPPDSVKMLPGSTVGYLRIESFNRHTPGELRSALARLRLDGATAFIIDLRNNPGGIVGAAVEIAQHFLPAGQTILTTRHRGNETGQTVKSASETIGERDPLTPLVLLVNPFTASASEIFAGALKDNGRARLVGMRTYGKGTLLRVVKLPDGGAMRFASGRYVTPSGQVIEGHGLEPDIIVKLPLEDLFKLSSQSRRAPGIIAPEGKNMIRDTQLEAALNLLSVKKL